MANDDTYTETNEPSSRLYVVSTGTRKDGVRLIAMVIYSR